MSWACAGTASPAKSNAQISSIWPCGLLRCTSVVPRQEAERPNSRTAHSQFVTLHNNLVEASSIRGQLVFEPAWQYGREPIPVGSQHLCHRAESFWVVFATSEVARFQRATNEKTFWEVVQPWWWTIAMLRKLHPASSQPGSPFMQASLCHVCLSGHHFSRHLGNLTLQCHVVHWLRTVPWACLQTASRLWCRL